MLAPLMLFCLGVSCYLLARCGHFLIWLLDVILPDLYSLGQYLFDLGVELVIIWASSLMSTAILTFVSEIGYSTG